MSSHNRVHYMDNLRAFAMLLGVFFHAALAYSPQLQQLWPTADPENSLIIDALAFFSHTFRMPLFFIVAGFFAALLLEKRGLGGLLKNRLLRITLPFVIFLPVVLVSFGIIIGWAMEHVQNKSPMLNMIVMMSQIPDAPAPPVTTTHLWFLYNLTFFYLLIVAFLKLAKHIPGLTVDWMHHMSKHPGLFLLLAPLLLVPALASQPMPAPAPEQFMPQLWSLGFFGLFFIFGWGLFSRQDFINQLKPYAVPMLLVSVVAYAGFYYWLPAPSGNLQEVMALAATPPALSAKHLLMASLEAYIAVYMCMLLLVLGQGFFDKQSKVVRAISDSSYWVYIVHMPVLWVIQFALLDTDYSLWSKFFIGSLGTLLIGFMTYILLVRWTPIGWLLNGRKRIVDISPEATTKKSLVGSE